jgi:hypothetical protein
MPLRVKSIARVRGGVPPEVRRERQASAASVATRPSINDENDGRIGGAEEVRAKTDVRIWSTVAAPMCGPPAVRGYVEGHQHLN